MAASKEYLSDTPYSLPLIMVHSSNILTNSFPIQNSGSLCRVTLSEMIISVCNLQCNDT